MPARDVRAHFRRSVTSAQRELVKTETITMSDFSFMSKEEILRGIITEKLTTAAREIFAVVERTVSAYEEEAAGLRQEIDRQRSQLEAVLQPRVSLEKKAVVKDEEGHEEVVLSEEEEERSTQQSGVEDAGSVWYGEDEAEEQQILALLTSPGYEETQDDCKDPDFQVPPRVRSGRRRPGRPRLIDSQNHVDFKIRILGNTQIDVLSNFVLSKYPVQDLRCPRGLREADFLDLLRSTFPQLAGQTDLEFFTSDRSKQLFPLSVESQTPEEIYRSIRPGKTTLYIRLKMAGDPRNGGDGVNLQGSEVSASTSADQTLSRSEDTMASEEPDYEDGQESGSAGLFAPLESPEIKESDDWEAEEPEETRDDQPVSSSRVPTTTQSSLKKWTLNGEALLSCKVCHAIRRSMNILIRHSWNHVEDPRGLCGVCGEHSESAKELRKHLQTHQKTHSCLLCGKSFLTVTGLKGHMDRHQGIKPYECRICHKAFPESGVLKTHILTHAKERPYKCPNCRKAYSSLSDLRRHMVVHSKTTQYRCNICGQNLCNFHSLSTHLMRHSEQIT
ncbi:zinc finger protein 436-like isoform X3 [Xyrichtys novacula]|uniref:Zinc finger protein 436-like isoform X3 n=1 Tax=Xyrichtys novacula TaxID=13765 RepID=A0AAV1EHY2_XYRNO|nr:zinc finger protein 436-like isoform X3 [Xyrichtys novacula]